MAARPPNYFNHNSQRPPLRPIHTTTHQFLRKLQQHVPNSTQLMGFLTLVISGGILLLLTGLTLTAIILGLIFFTPLILVSSPIWVPTGTLLFIAVSGFLSVCGFGASTFAAISWAYRYFKRSRIADTATHMKD
ncbi:oleosin-like [Nicotiana tabacum]|uniref:Oleosin 16.4 kDa-like n=2 Tax=Nicotiana TaxID=4085 RepID=A0A1S4DQ22_TOBAC|nr:PREDICTED: oleosin 16.4 kDa-like [Nicotiana sylvestris]XP_016515234.1 PREDICTED: oleosin 16.4 kDa-like [Nicotiana tabacum]